MSDEISISNQAIHSLVVTAPDGTRVKAEVWEWVAAIVSMLPQPQLAELCRRVERSTGAAIARSGVILPHAGPGGKPVVITTRSL